MKKVLLFYLLLVCTMLGFFSSCYYDNAEDLYQNFATDCDTTVVSFSADIKSIIDNNCISCHGPSAPQGGLSLTNYSQIDDAIKNRDLLGRIQLPPGNPARMPPNGMSDCHIQKILAWVNMGLPNN